MESIMQGGGKGNFHPQRSSTEESGDDRRRQRQRREANTRESGRGRDSYREEKYNGNSRRRDWRGEPDNKSRRSRSPAEDSHQRRYDGGYREQSRRSPLRPPRDTTDLDRNCVGNVQQRDSRDRHMRHPKDYLDKQVSRRKDSPLPSQAETFLMIKVPSSISKPTPEKEKPNFAPTGQLARVSNTILNTNGTSTVLKYHEPPEARKPPAKDQWKLFVFKGDNIIETIELSVRSCWLIGREISVVDLLAEHPSISKQHAVIQFRWIERQNEFGDKLGRVKPYLIDLESANGTILNKEPLPASRYLELRDKDMVQFGDSTREYVLMLAA